LQQFVLFCDKIVHKILLYFGIKSRILSRRIESPRYGGRSLLLTTIMHSQCSGGGAWDSTGDTGRCNVTVA